MTYYDLFILVKMKLCREIQYEIDDLLVDGDSAQLACDWLFIDDTISKAWLKYSRRPAGYYDGILQPQSCESGLEKQQRVPSWAQRSLGPLHV